MAPNDEAGFSPERIDAAVADGLAVMRYSALMALKNRIIVSGIRDGVTFDPGMVRVMAGEELHALADEQRDNARITQDALRRLRRRRWRKGSARHDRDYRLEDVDALEARTVIYGRIADALDGLRDDRGYLDELAESARLRAWDEIGATVSARLERVVTAQDAAYERNRDERIRIVKEVDLRGLEQDRRTRPR